MTFPNILEEEGKVVSRIFGFHHSGNGASFYNSPATWCITVMFVVAFARKVNLPAVVNILLSAMVTFGVCVVVDLMRRGVVEGVRMLWRLFPRVSAFFSGGVEDGWEAA